MRGRERTPDDVIPAPALRCLFALLRLCDQGREPTIRELCRALGRTNNSVQRALALLKARGLVEWDAGRWGTLRPLCYAVIYREG